MVSVFDPLIALSRHRISADEAMWIIEQLENGTDSSAAILGATLAETVLKDLLLATFIPSKSGHQNLFRRNGTLANFESSIHLAYALGLISKAALHDLTAIRHIGNAFAHAPATLISKQRRSAVPVKA
jgi:DNA-binding MltR family transcriptional regulator